MIIRTMEHIRKVKTGNLSGLPEGIPRCSATRVLYITLFRVLLDRSDIIEVSSVGRSLKVNGGSKDNSYETELRDISCSASAFVDMVLKADEQVGMLFSEPERQPEAVTYRPTLTPDQRTDLSELRLQFEAEQALPTTEPGDRDSQKIERDVISRALRRHT